MPRIDQLYQVPKAVFPVFFVVNTSKRMEGTLIAGFNLAMRDTIEALKEAAATSYEDIALKIAILEFNSEAKWHFSGGMEEIEDFFYEDLQVNGQACMGKALRELNDKLSRKKYLKVIEDYGFFPLIVFVTDGHSDDGWQEELEKIRQNRWYEHSMKIGIGIGENVDWKAIAEVVGTEEAVIGPDNLDLFIRLIHFVDIPKGSIIEDTDEFTPLPEPQKCLKPIFLMFDTSASMQGEKIEALNQAVKNAFKTVGEKKYEDCDIKFFVMGYNHQAEWKNVKGGSYPEDYLHEDFKAEGMTSVGNALKELKDEISGMGSLEESYSVILPPTIIFMTDGAATDNYKEVLQELWKYRYFDVSHKIGIALGEDADVDMLADICGEKPFWVKNITLFEKLLTNSIVLVCKEYKEKYLKEILSKIEENIVLIPRTTLNGNDYLSAVEKRGKLCLSCESFYLEEDLGEAEVCRCQIECCMPENAHQVYFHIKNEKQEEKTCTKMTLSKETTAIVIKRKLTERTVFSTKEMKNIYRIKGDYGVSQTEEGYVLEPWYKTKQSTMSYESTDEKSLVMLPGMGREEYVLYCKVAGGESWLLQNGDEVFWADNGKKIITYIEETESYVFRKELWGGDWS